MSDPIRIDLIIFGKVQGVGFRNFVKNEAESLGIKGFVKNRNDGSVFIAAQGNKKSLESLVNSCYKGSHYSVVKKIKKFQNHTENINDFSIIF